MTTAMALLKMALLKMAIFENPVRGRIKAAIPTAL
jgi:hypothetical protein